jgi:nifR3 family TIM-barrel protein
MKAGNHTDVQTHGLADNSGFWRELARPFVVLAPMANVTDSVFRTIIAKYGKPDVMWTEFVSADGLMSAGRNKLLVDLQFSSKERPIVAQLFTGHAAVMASAAALVAELGFDGLDINMGCPDRAVEKQGGGAAMIKNFKNAIEVITAARNGVRTFATKKKPPIPVSVKTRIGYNKVDWDWIKLLLGQHLPALTIHLRTRKEMSDVPAHWDLMPEIIRLRNVISPDTLIIGNGDVATPAQARELCAKNGCDGVMIGRGIFGKPWNFEKVKIKNKRAKRNTKELEISGGEVSCGQAPADKSPKERLKILVEHATLFEKTFKGIKNFDVMKKHFKAYVSGWDGAKELRVKLMETSNSCEVKKVVSEYLKAR